MFKITSFFHLTFILLWCIIVHGGLAMTNQDSFISKVKFATGATLILVAALIMWGTEAPMSKETSTSLWVVIGAMFVLGAILVFEIDNLIADIFFDRHPRRFKGFKIRIPR